MTAATLFSGLRLPLLCAPMSFASSLPMALACCTSGVIGGWQGGNVKTIEEFELYLTTLADAEKTANAEGKPWAPHAINIPSAIMRDPELGKQKIDLCEKMRVPLLFSSIGDPGPLVKRAHDWGGVVIHDVTTVKHAEKAIAAGVDGLMVTCAGAGGHSGLLTPMAFVPKVRSMFEGIILMGGGVANGAGIAGALALGADLAVMGTRFIATNESGAVDGHKRMIAEAGMQDIMMSDVVNGLDANWIRQSIEKIGWDPAHLPEKRGPMRGAEMPEGVRPWRDIWSAGHSAGLIDDVLPVATLIDRLIGEFEQTDVRRDWRDRLAKRLV
ncbi:MAG: nitronate monooxygenase [Caulobacterales bacterium]